MMKQSLDANQRRITLPQKKYPKPFMAQWPKLSLGYLLAKDHVLAQGALCNVRDLRAFESRVEGSQGLGCRELGGSRV